MNSNTNSNSNNGRKKLYKRYYLSLSGVLGDEANIIFISLPLRAIKLTAHDPHVM